MPLFVQGQFPSHNLAASEQYEWVLAGLQQFEKLNQSAR
jgi:hypothetical protein